MVVPYVGMDVPLAAVKVREDLKSGNCCCALEAGMMDTQAPVSTRYCMDVFSSVAYRPVCGVVAVATGRRIYRAFSFLAGMYIQGHTWQLFLRTSGENRTLNPSNSSAARVVSGGCEQVAGDVLGAHWNVRMLLRRV